MSYVAGVQSAEGVVLEQATYDTADEAIAYLVRECDEQWDEEYEESGGYSDAVFLPLHTALHNHNLAFTKVFEMECNGILYYARLNA